jgi:hypothetical protein
MFSVFVGMGIASSCRGESFSIIKKIHAKQKLVKSLIAAHTMYND